MTAIAANTTIPFFSQPSHSEFFKDMPFFCWRIDMPAGRTSRPSKKTSRTGSFQPMNGYQGNKNTMAQTNKSKLRSAMMAMGTHKANTREPGSITISAVTVTARMAITNSMLGPAVNPVLSASVLEVIISVSTIVHMPLEYVQDLPSTTPPVTIPTTLPPPPYNLPPQSL